MRVLLVDDEPLALEKLQVFFCDIPDTEVVGTAGDGVAAIEAVARLRPDLVILDIQMPGRSGLAVAGDLAAEGRPQIVFVTAYEHFAPDAFDVEATDYVLKPVRLERLRQAVARARRRCELQRLVDPAARPTPAPSAPAADARYQQALEVHAGSGVVRLPVTEIDWIEAAKDYVILHTSTRSHMVRVTMAMLEETLDPAVLVRVHRSAFVRRDAVAQVERAGGGAVAVVLKDGATLQVGPSFARTVAERLAGI
jgi:two-component system, LytTR family, response regulator